MRSKAILEQYDAGRGATVFIPHGNWMEDVSSEPAMILRRKANFPGSNLGDRHERECSSFGQDHRIELGC